MERTNLKIVSYNCRCFNASKVPCISEILTMCDILLLQEIWLYSSQFCLFTTYLNTYYNNVSICGLYDSVSHAGMSCTDIYPIYLGNSKRTCGIKWKLHDSDGFVHLFKVQMPCNVNTAMYNHDFNNELSSITIYCLQHNVKYCIIGGDFNADISRVNSMYTASLHNFVSDEGLMFCMKSENCINIDYTYYGPNQAFVCN